MLVATDNDPAGRKAAEADYWKLITRGADPRELRMPGVNDPAELYQQDPQLLATVLDASDQAPSLAQALIDTRINAWAKTSTVNGLMLGSGLLAPAPA